MVAFVTKVDLASTLDMLPGVVACYATFPELRRKLIHRKNVGHDVHADTIAVPTAEEKRGGEVRFQGVIEPIMSYD